MDYYKERLSAFTYAIGELTQTYTSTYIHKEGNDLEEQSHKGHNPLETGQCMQGIFPVFALLTCMERLDGKYIQHHEKYRRSHTRENKEGVKAII